jgi:hypothetical protein
MNKKIETVTVTDTVTTEIDVVLRVDANCTNAPEADPLTIDLFDADDNFNVLLHSFSVDDLIREMIRSRSNSDGQLDELAPFISIRDQLRELANLIDAALPISEEDVA